MIQIIVSGASGQLGRTCVELLSFKEGYSVFSFDHSQLDIADREKTHRILASLPQVKFWINCAAYTRVDDAESNVRAATLYNAIAPGFIAAACNESGVHYIDFSSDYVYHNALRSPLKEDDPLEPKGIYARTKFEGEIEISKTGADYTILRTSWVYGPDGHNFVNTMLRLGKKNSQLSIVGDQLGAPTYTHDIVSAIKDLITLHQEGNKDKIRGVFNFANAGEVTWADFARTIFKHTGMNCEVKNITAEEYGASASRPPYSVLNCEKIAVLLSKPIPHWEDALVRYLHQLEVVKK